ncbi:MAG: hypothetical protein UT34_C0001G0515 [candidate division WS6 bacterium GW2011_GWF2_39_15]|uniref:Phosphoglycerol geranylgeranyltransferase n=1 Tax=candidate division WS6 bacterium GW2011_GWF2_39_15 TaxID=1619100 RepID=A0A0G0MR13_9BACT|nr:MAG: hypothetical protein UT34_C0001G0515 [candidate division WS6 bacterium GW2011_GWF2_39_15]
MHRTFENPSFSDLSAIYNSITSEKGNEQNELLERIQTAGIMPVIDPEEAFKDIGETIEKVRALEGLAGVVLVGGSTSTEGETETVVAALRGSIESRGASIKLIGFPGRKDQVVQGLHGLLFLYPPQLQTVFLGDPQRAGFLVEEAIGIRERQKKLGISVIPTTYILFGGGRQSSVVEQTKISPIRVSPGYEIDEVWKEASSYIEKGLVFLEGGSGSAFANLGPIAQLTYKKTGILPIVSGGISLPNHVSEITSYGKFPLGLGSLIERTDVDNVQHVYQEMINSYTPD